MRGRSYAWPECSVKASLAPGGGGGGGACWCARSAPPCAALCPAAEAEARRWAAAPQACRAGAARAAAQLPRCAYEDTGRLGLGLGLGLRFTDRVRVGIRVKVKVVLGVRARGHLRARGRGAVGERELVRGLRPPLGLALDWHAAVLCDPRAARHARRHDGRSKLAEVIGLGLGLGWG